MKERSAAETTRVHHFTRTEELPSLRWVRAAFLVKEE
jgi:hypothetical protein